MKTSKKILDTCAPEAMIFGGFLITGALCLATESYDGAAVCAGVAVLAAVVAWRRFTKAGAVEPENRLPEPSTVSKRKPAKPRKVTKAKKKPAKRAARK